MADDLTQGTNDNTTSANSGTPQEPQSTILGGNQEPPTKPTQQEPSVEPTTQEPITYDFSQAFESGEVDQTIAADFSKLLNSVGATQEQAVEMAKFGNKYATDLVTAYEEKKQEALAEQYEGYKKHAEEVLGNKYEATVQKAAAGMELIEKTIPNIREILAENGLGNRIEVIKMFEKIADMGAEDNNAGGGQPTGSTQSEDAIRRNLYPSMFK